MTVRHPNKDKANTNKKKANITIVIANKIEFLDSKKDNTFNNAFEASNDDIPF